MNSFEMDRRKRRGAFISIDAVLDRLNVTIPFDVDVIPSQVKVSWPYELADGGLGSAREDTELDKSLPFP